MQAEEAVEIEHGLLRNVDVGAHRVVIALSVGNNDIQSIGCTTLEDYDQTLGAAAVFKRAECGTREKAGNCSCADYGESAITKEDAARDGHKRLLASSREPRAMSQPAVTHCSQLVAHRSQLIALSYLL